MVGALTDGVNGPKYDFYLGGIAGAGVMRGRRHARGEGGE